MRDNLYDEVELLQKVKKYVETSYDFEVDMLSITIYSDGTLKFFCGDELADAFLLDLDLSMDELTEDDLISTLEDDYDYEIRQYLLVKIEEDNSTISTAELKILAGV
jgi:hypothetical protein